VNDAINSWLPSQDSSLESKIKNKNKRKREKQILQLFIFNGWGTYPDIFLRYGGHIFMLVLFDYP